MGTRRPQPSDLGNPLALPVNFTRSTLLMRPGLFSGSLACRRQQFARIVFRMPAQIRKACNQQLACL